MIWKLWKKGKLKCETMGSSLETLRFEVGNIPKCMLVSLGLWTEIDNLDHSSNNAPDPLYIDLFIVFNATFSNISAISVGSL
jgi:hypothetical protein